MIDLEERFWAKVDKSGDCWTWTASTNDAGYGLFRLAGVTRKAHRVAYEITAGQIPAGMNIDHICHVPACVRPDHLRLATTKQNAENRSGARSDSATGIRGVTWHVRIKKWVVSVGHNGTRHHVGYFDALPDAQNAAIAKRNALFTHNAADGAGL